MFKLKYLVKKQDTNVRKHAMWYSGLAPGMEKVTGGKTDEIQKNILSFANTNILLVSQFWQMY